jgi:hypothetical protein
MGRRRVEKMRDESKPKMSAWSFGKMSVANAEMGTSEGTPSRE